MGLFIFLTFLLPTTTFANQNYDLDELNDLELESLDNQKHRSTESNNNRQRLILFDDNLYLLDDNFDFGEDELELKKLELNVDDMETANEYEDFLNAFFENSTIVGSNSRSQSGTLTNKHSKKNKIKSNSKPKSSKKTSKKSSKKTSKRSQNNSSTSSNFNPKKGALGFGVSAIIGTTIPVTMPSFSSGANFGIHLDTPVSFNLLNMEAKVGTELYFSHMNSINADALAVPYRITSIVGNVGVAPISSIEVRFGLGFTPGSIGGATTGLVIGIPVDLIYYLPMNISGFRFALNLHAQTTRGYPTLAGADDGDNSTDFINLGLLINTPLGF